MRLFHLIFPLLFLTIISCKEEPPIPEQTLIKTYCDLIIMQDTTKLTLPEIKEAVYKNNNITSQQYEDAINFYNSDPERWNTFFEKAIKYIEAKRDSVKKQT